MKLDEAAARIFNRMGHLTEDALGIYGPQEVEADIRRCLEDGTADALCDQLASENHHELTGEAVAWYRAQLEAVIREAKRPAESGPALPCYRCGRQPTVDRDGAYVYVYCDNCYDGEGSSQGATYTGRVTDALSEWDDIMDGEWPYEGAEAAS